ncbi:MAG: DUF4147 domain-containing protein [Gemmatimonadaceae bacterium]
MTTAQLKNPRALLTSLHQAAVQGANPFVRTRDAVIEWLHSSNIDSSARLHIFALGKAGATMASGAAEALEQHGIKTVGGVVVVAARPSENAAAEQGGALPTVLEIRVGDHPVPDLGSLAAADVIARKVNDVQNGDIALVLISGGATSLCAAPCAELREHFGHAAKAHELITDLAKTLHANGLAIHEMNAVRRRLLRWGGGRLAVALHERGAASIQVFAVSDVIGDDPSVIGSGPCSPDPISECEFFAMLDAYNLRDKISRALAVALGFEGSSDQRIIPPTANSPAFDLVQFAIVARNVDSCNAMAVRARELGIGNVTVVTTPIMGEAETVGHTIASLALRSAADSDEEQLIVWGGEPTVSMNNDERVFGDDEGDEPLPDTLNVSAPDRPPSSFTFGADSNAGEGPNGGRMQALALAACLAFEQAEMRNDSKIAGRIALLAAGTDGRDGPTDACGAIVNFTTPMAARQHGRDPIRDLHRFRSYPALDAASALLRTGPTGTNVMDVVAAYIAPSKAD